jgi:hypothetical protein
MWWDSESGIRFVYYNDGTSSQWVQESYPSGGITNPYNQPFTFSNTDVSTSTTTGAVIVSGGVGIGGALSVGTIANTGSILLRTGSTLATQFQVTDVAGATRPVDVRGGVAGASFPGIGTGAGAESFGVFSNTNSIHFSTGGYNTTRALSIAHVSSAVNYLTVNPAIAGGNTNLTATGSSTDIGINLVPKGNGTVQISGSPWQKTKTLLFTLLSYYIAPSSTATTIAVTGASGTGSIATLTFSAITTAIPVGTVITVTGMNPSGYNATNVLVTASSTTSVSYASTTATTFVSGGTIANGTSYTPSVGAVIASIMCIGAGGGGGFGGTYAAATGGSGGGGGGAAGTGIGMFKVSDLTAFPYTVTIPAGGTGGTSGTPIGTAGSYSSVGSIIAGIRSWLHNRKLA